jgi:hypothetical protein
MTQVQLDEVLRQKLAGAVEPIEILGESGEIIGHFVPTPTNRELDYSRVAIPFDDAEIKRRRGESEGGKLADFWNRMGRS